MVKIHSCTKRYTIAFSWFAILLTAAFVLQNPSGAAQAVYNALILCVKNVIPTLFPYMVISTLFVTSGLASFVGRGLAKPFSKLFALNGSCSAAVIIGLAAGFPVGAKTAVCLYQDGLCKKEEAQRLCAFCNNTGPAFVVGAIGAGFFGSAALGAALYGIEVVCSLAVGFLFSIGQNRKRAAGRGVVCYRLDFAAAVKDAVSSVLAVCGFVVFFSVLLNMVSELLLAAGFGELLAPFSCVLEVTTGASLAAQTGGMGGFILAAFAIGWSGVCVHAQSASFMLPAGLSRAKYMAGKALQGAMCALLAMPVYLFFQ